MKKDKLLSLGRMKKDPYTVGVASLFSFLLVFFILFPLFIGKSVNKPLQPIDWSPMAVPGGDYVATYAAANSLRSNFSIYKNNAEHGKAYKDRFAAGEYSRYSYPPLQAFLFLPLSFVSFKQSYFLWNILSVGLIIVSIGLVSQLVRRRLVTFLFLTTLYGLSSFLWFHLERGQTDSLSLFFISLLLYLYVKRKSVVFTALFLSLACLLKVFPLIFVVFFLIRKEYKLLAISFLFGVGIMIFTGMETWVYWATTILPMYSAYYLGSEVDHSFSYLLSGFIDLPFPIIVQLSRTILLAVSGIFFLCVFFGRHRKEWLLLELAILSIIMEIFPPWAANYKLVIMPFFFLIPAYLIERGFTGKKLGVVLPILGAFVLFLPIYNEFYGRLLLSSLGLITPGNFLPYFDLQKIGEYRASLAIAFSLFYLLFLYAYLQFHDTRMFEKTVLSLQNHRRELKILSLVFVISLVVVGGVFVSQRYTLIRAEYQKKITAYNQDLPIIEGVSVVGYDLRKMNNGSYEMEIIFRVDKALERNLTIYLHGHWLDGSGNIEGANFFPPLLTNFWPQGKYVVVKKSIFLTPVDQDIRIGFFDMSDGQRFGKEVDLGTKNLK